MKMVRSNETTRSSGDRGSLPVKLERSILTRKYSIGGLCIKLRYVKNRCRRWFAVLGKELKVILTRLDTFHTN